MKTRIFIVSVMLFMSVVVKADCTVEQRIELAKAGYGKGEIEGMCKSQQESVSKDPTANKVNNSEVSLQGLALLSQGSIAGSNREGREARRCSIKEEGVDFKGEIVNFDKLKAIILKKVNEKKQTIYYGVQLRPKEGFNVLCVVMIVDNWRYKKDDNSLFLSDVEKYQAEYDAVIKELSLRNVELKDGSR